MSSSLTRRLADSLISSDGGLSARQRREVGREVDRVSGRAVVRAAQAQADAFVAKTRVQSASYVSQVGLRELAVLSAEEASFVAQAPLGEQRYKAVLDTLAGVVAHEVAKLGYEQ